MKGKSKDIMEEALRKYKKNVDKANTYTLIVAGLLVAYICLSTIFCFSHIHDTCIYLAFLISSFFVFRLVKHRTARYEFLSDINDFLGTEDDLDDNK